MSNSKAFVLATSGNSNNFTVSYPNIIKKDLQDNFQSSFNMVEDNVVAVRLSDDLFQDGEYFILFDFSLSFTLNRVAPSLLSDIYNVDLGEISSRILLNTVYVVQS